MSDGDAGSAKWRCAWCDKPHERNDPPCDNCGHHKFEKAVVPVAPETTDYQREPVWVCPECGRSHQKNSPPCSRCGNASLEKHVPEDEDFAEELGGTSYWDVLEPQYVAGMAFALVAGAVLVLAALGVVTLPGMGAGVPTVEGVPGTGNVSNGVALEEVEAGVLAAVNDRRGAASADALTRDATLDEVATFLNQRRVKAAYTDDATPEADGVGEAVREACGDSDPVAVRSTTRPGESAFGSADALTAAVGDVHAEETGDAREFETGRTGLDVHVGPDDRVFVTQVSC